MRLRPRRSRMMIGAASALVATLAISACGADTTDSGGGDSETIKIGMILPIDAAATSLPNTVAAAKVAEKAINSRGGVNGKKIELIPCDDKADPATASTCAQKLLNEDGVVALSSSLSYGGDAIYPALKAADVVNFGNYPASAPDLSDSLSFPLVEGIGGFGAVGAAGLADPAAADIKKLAVVTTEGTAADAIFPAVTAAAASKSISTELVAAPLTITNWAPIAAKVKSSGASGIVLALIPDQVAPAILALGQEGLGKLPIIMSASNATDQIVDDIDSRSVKAIWGSQLITDPGKSALRKQYDDEIAQYGSEVGGVQNQLTETVVFAWLGLTKLADVLAQLPTIDRKSLKDYLNQQNAFDTGMTEKLDFTQPAPDTFPRGFNRWASSSQLANGQLVQPNLAWIEQP